MKPVLTTFSRPAPDAPLVGDDLRLVAALDRLGLEPLVDAQQAGHREAPDVGVEHADGEPLGGDRRSEVDGDRALADAALAAGDGAGSAVDGETSVSGAFSRAFQRALSMTSLRSSLVISPQSMRTLVTPGCTATRVSMSFLIWARSGHPPIVSLTPTVTTPSSDDRDRRTPCPSVTMSAPEFRVDDGPQQRR